MQWAEADVDALLPPEMAEKAEAIGVAKCGMPAGKTFALGVLAGAFIAFGAIFSTTAVAGSTLPYGVNRVIAGTVFSVGLILVIIGGAELFTGNNLIVMAWANKKVRTLALLRNWALVFAGNAVGGVGIAALTFAAGQYRFGASQVGATALAIADAKCKLDFGEALAVCAELGLGDLLSRMPAGLGQLVGETGWQLSHGERSRLYIARALLQAPDVLVLDESFAALDPETLNVCMACVRRRARTLLVVAHP